MYNKQLSLNLNNSDVYYNLACLYSLYNKKDEAFANLRLAIENGFSDKKWIQSDFDLDNIRNTKEFDNLLNQLN